MENSVQEWKNDGKCQYGINSFYKETTGGQADMYYKEYKGDSRVNDPVPSSMEGERVNSQKGA